jgi:hypothetical protein
MPQFIQTDRRPIRRELIRDRDFLCPGGIQIAAPAILAGPSVAGTATTVILRPELQDFRRTNSIYLV